MTLLLPFLYALCNIVAITAFLLFFRWAERHSVKKGWRIAKLWVLSERKEVKYPAIVLFGVACLFCGSMAYMSFIDKKPASLSIAFGLVSCLCVAIIFTFLIEEDE